MSPLTRGSLRPALNLTVAGALAALALVGGSASDGPAAARPDQVETVTPGVTLVASTVTTHRRHHHRHRAGISADRALRALHVARAQTGDRYVYGATGPNAFDCSGLTAYAYRIATGKHLPHNSSAQQGSTRRISARAARPGDLVFFHHDGHVYHVAIYAGRHTIIHAPYPGQRVKRERIWTSAVTYGRVV
jgi:cell wall-associated NlpC family hydrolase